MSACCHSTNTSLLLRILLQIQMATKIFPLSVWQHSIKSLIYEKISSITNIIFSAIHTHCKVDFGHIVNKFLRYALSIFQELDFPNVYSVCEFPRRNGAKFRLRRKSWVFGNGCQSLQYNLYSYFVFRIIYTLQIRFLAIFTTSWNS